MTNRFVRLVALLILTVAVVQAQPKRVITLRYNALPSLSVGNAMRSMLLTWMTTHREDTVYCYIGQSFYWNGPDGREYRFSVDSIVGRGANRIVLLKRAHKTPDPASWFEYISARPTADTASYDSVLYQAVRPTSDSTWRLAKWMRYTGEGYGDQIWSTWLPGTDSVARQIGVRMIRVIGDPTKFNGANQQAMLTFYYREAVRPRTTAWMDSVSAVAP